MKKGYQHQKGPPYEIPNQRKLRTSENELRGGRQNDLGGGAEPSKTPTSRKVFVEQPSNTFKRHLRYGAWARLEKNSRKKGGKTGGKLKQRVTFVILSSGARGGLKK